MWKRIFFTICFMLITTTFTNAVYLAQDANAHANNYYWIYDASGVIDDNSLSTVTGWCSGQAGTNWIYLDWPIEVDLDGVKIFMEGGNYNIQDFTIQTLNDAAEPNATTGLYDNPSDWNTVDTVISFDATVKSASLVKIFINS